MKIKAPHVQLDKSRLLAFNQITTANGQQGSLKTPAMTMFGVKVLQAGNPAK
jgi:hypothetical protein